MCTVTFIPVNDRCFITSNRDEKAARLKAIPPAVYADYKATLLYPKDAAANGTWIAMNQLGNAAVLLNGAFVKHDPEPPYRKSRGLIFLDIIAGAEPVDWFAEMNLYKIEPFTVAILQQGKLYECRWDGMRKHYQQLDEKQPHIWSSATLYPDEVISKRKQWFSKWVTDHPQPSQKDIFLFHQFAGDGDSHNDVLMNRDGHMLTVSITGIEVSSEKGAMHYLDLQEGSCTIRELNFETSPVIS
jgi:Transport and Golgi organisation 2